MATTARVPKKAAKKSRSPARKKAAKTPAKKGRGRLSAKSDEIAKTRLELENLPVTLTAEVFGIDKKVLYDWVGRGAPRNDDGSFHLPATLRWRLDELANDSSNGTESPELRRFRAARADIMEMERDTKRGKLLEKADVDRREVEQIAVLKRGFVMIDKRIGAEAGAAPAGVARREHRQLLLEIGGGGNGHAKRDNTKA